MKNLKKGVDKHKSSVYNTSCSERDDTDHIDTAE